jgi:RNA polymerase sigma-70 factor (ECF subfamily)
VHRLVDIYRRHAGVAVDLDPGAESALEHALSRALADARARRPTVSVDDVAIVRAIAEHAAPDGDPAAAVAALHTGDLLLASARLAGDRTALAIFDETFMPGVREAVRTIDPSPAFGDEIVQRLRERLLVAAGDGPARLAEYSGRGALAAWLRVAAIRTALNARRADHRYVAAEGLDRIAGGANPELEVLRRTYRQEFADAFRESVRALEDRERAILRLSVVDGLDQAALAALYRVSVSTISRWLARARDRIAEDTERRLRSRLRLTSSEFDSLAALVVSQLDVSLASQLRSGD